MWEGTGLYTCMNTGNIHLHQYHFYKMTGDVTGVAEGVKECKDFPGRCLKSRRCILTLTHPVVYQGSSRGMATSSLTLICFIGDENVESISHITKQGNTRMFHSCDPAFQLFTSVVQDQCGVQEGHWINDL